MALVEDWCGTGEETSSTRLLAAGGLVKESLSSPPATPGEVTSDVWTVLPVGTFSPLEAKDE